MTTESKDKSKQGGDEVRTAFETATPTTARGWAFALAEASNAAACVGAKADEETYLAVVEAIMNQRTQAPVVGDGRELPQLLSEDEKKNLLQKAEALWDALEKNNLGGFSGINRPYLILHEFKEVIEQFGRRDVGLTWSYNDLKKARQQGALKG